MVPPIFLIFIRNYFRWKIKSRNSRKNECRMMAKKWLCPYRLSVYEFNCNILLWFWEILKCEKTDGSHRHTHAHTHIHTAFMSTRDTPIEFIIVFWSFVAPAGGFIATINVNVECSLIFILFSFLFVYFFSPVCSHFQPRYLFHHICCSQWPTIPNT